MHQEQPVSLWDASAAEDDFAAEMDGDNTTELAIVGGGFTGLSTALHAAEKGVDAHVRESRKIGYDGSGRNAGLVNAGLWLPPQDVRERLGEKRGSRLTKVLGDAPEYVFSLIEKHQIRCEATRNGTIHAAHSPKMAGLLTGGKEDDLPLPVTELKNAPSRAIASRLYQAAFTANRLLKSL